MLGGQVYAAATDMAGAANNRVSAVKRAAAQSAAAM
jgi:hypothetical protein